MTFLQHEIDLIADRIIDRIGDRIVRIVHKEMEIMTQQAVTDLTAATDAVVAELSDLVTNLQADAKALADALANQPGDTDPAIEAQVKRLNDGAAAAKAAVQALQTPASPSPLVQPEANGAVGGTLPGTAPVGEAAALQGKANQEAAGAPVTSDPTIARDVPASA